MRPQELTRSTAHERGEPEAGPQYLLVRPDCVLADAPAFQTTNPTWSPGDEFIGADGTQRYRILDIVASDRPHSYSGLFILELVEGTMAGPGLLRPVADHPQR